MLVHDYTFTSRDGSDRPSNSQAANTLVQLLSSLVNVPGVLQGLGKEKLYEIINEIFRLSGTGVDTKLEIKPGEDPTFGPSQDQVQQAIQELGKAIQDQGKGLAETQQQVEQILKALTTAPTPQGSVAPGVPGGAAPMQTINPAMAMASPVQLG